MKPESKSQRLLGITRSKAKMYEYDVPASDHIEITRDPGQLLILAIGLLGDAAAQIAQATGLTSISEESRANLQFAAFYFDSYFQSKLKREIDQYLLIVAASAYYLCDLPGSANVISAQIDNDNLNLNCAGLDKLLSWILKGHFQIPLAANVHIAEKDLNTIAKQLECFFQSGLKQKELFNSVEKLRRCAYSQSDPRQLLFADIIAAIVKKRCWNSSWVCLPSYSNIPLDTWRGTIQNPDFIKELWPAQHLLGRKSVFSGNSATVQMPTSAGKTRAAEIIIRSAFISGRTNLAVIVAPFRALCNEIKNSLTAEFSGEKVYINELTDVLQTDFELGTFIESNQILIVTPEKFLYVLRHSPQLADKIGLIIYDEGHQFDNGQRGVTYELLLTALKSMIPEHAQKVLISAVISNAQEINTWLNKDVGTVVSGESLSTTYRSIAFTSWKDPLGRLEFVDSRTLKNEFFVPRIIEPMELGRKPRERKKLLFPQKGNSGSIALYLGLKLSPNGSVAVFCGTKRYIPAICRELVNSYERNLSITPPINHSNQEEINRLFELYKAHLGDTATETQAAALGVLTHHATLPQGIRLSVEYAMKEGFAHMVICTSTLAQGVNLPIKYLVVAHTHQGSEFMKVRDFHNLVGRVGRAGMYTEGSIIFSDPSIYDDKDSNQYKWGRTKRLLNIGNAEPCASSLLTIFKPILSVDKKYYFDMPPLHFVQEYVAQESRWLKFCDTLSAELLGKKFTIEDVRDQIISRMQILSSIESFLMTHMDDDVLSVEDLAKQTLAYHVASNDEQRENIVQLFKDINEYILGKIPDSSRRKIFGKTLQSVRDSLKLEAWVKSNIDVIVSAENTEELFEVLWPLLQQQINNIPFKKCNSQNALKYIAQQWLSGVPYYQIFENTILDDVKIGSGPRPSNIKLENVVDICEGAFSYESMLVLGAVIELFGEMCPDEDITIQNLRLFQKSLKYGIPSSKAIDLYELGFSDRILAQELGEIFSKTVASKVALTRRIQFNRPILQKILDKYPSYFSFVLNNICKS